MKSVHAFAPRALISTAVIVALLSGARCDAWSQAKSARSSQSNSAILADKDKIFGQYAGAFLEFAKAHMENDSEWRVTNDLHDIASDTRDQVDFARTLVFMYETLICKEDRKLTLPLVKLQLELASKITGLNITQTTHSLAFVKAPATAQLGLRMKDDLGELQGLLDSLRKRLD